MPTYARFASFLQRPVFSTALSVLALSMPVRATAAPAPAPASGTESATTSARGAQVQPLAQPIRGTSIWAGKLLVDARKAVLAQQTVVVMQDQIVGVYAGYLSIEECATHLHAAGTLAANQPIVFEQVDLRQSFVMPGMVDAHVHLSSESDHKDARLDPIYLTKSERTLQAVQLAANKVRSGFTTVRDLGGDPEVVVALRNAIAKHQIVGPTMLVSAGTITPLAGHGDANGFRPGLLPVPAGVCNGADDCRRAVREAVKLGADVIKYTATGGVLSNIAAGTGQQLTMDEQLAIVETAHALGRKVAAHAHDLDGINAALQAGVDSIEHGTFLDASSLKLFRKTGAYLVPTLTVADWATKAAEIPGELPPASAAKARRVGPKTIEGLKRAYRAGVKIVLGSDFSRGYHRLGNRELVLLQQAGMSPKEVLIAATISAADLLGRSEQIGTLAVGKTADIIAAKGDPLADVSTLLAPIFVMARGEIVLQEGVAKIP